MKKWLALLLAGICVVTISGCSVGSNIDSVDFNRPSATSSEADGEKPAIDGYNYDNKRSRICYEDRETKLYLEGTFQVSSNDGTIHLLIQNDEGDWSVLVGNQSAYDAVKLEELAGQPVQIFGTYQESSDARQLLLACEEIRTKTKNYKLTDFALDLETYFVRLHEAAEPILYSQIKDGDYHEKPFVLEGIASKVEQYEALSGASLKLIQHSEDGYQSEEFISDLSYELCPHIQEIETGDFIRLYGRVSADEKEYYIGVEKIDPQFSLEDVKADYVSQCEAVDYESLARSPEEYKRKKVQMKGKVIQVLEDRFGVEMRVDITQGDYGLWDDTIYVTFGDYDKNHRILEDDIIQIYGIAVGTKTYTSILGAEITLPEVYAKYIDLVEDTD